MEFNQQKASLSLMWSLRVLASLAEQGMHRFLRITLKCKVQRRSVKCQKLLHSLVSFPSSKFLCVIHHIQWGTVRLPSHPLSKFFVLNVLCPVFCVAIQSCWNNKLQAVYSSFLCHWVKEKVLRISIFYFIGSAHVVYDQEMNRLIFRWQSSFHTNSFVPLTNQWLPTLLRILMNLKISSKNNN